MLLFVVLLGCQCNVKVGLTEHWCCVAYCLELNRRFARTTFCRTSLVFAVQMNALGFLICTAIYYSSMASMSSGTLVNTPRRSRSTVKSRKNRSTRFIQDAEIGEKCITNRGCFLRHFSTSGCLCVAMTLPALANDGAVEHIQCGEQCGRTVTFVIVRHGLCPSFFNGNPDWVRSSACTSLFSSQHRRSALSGGDMYSPTISSSVKLLVMIPH